MNHGYCYKCVFWSKLIYGLCLFHSKKLYKHYTKPNSYCPDYTKQNNSLKIIEQVKNILKNQLEDLK